MRSHADYSVGRPLIGRGFAHAPLGTNETNFPGQATFDSVNQRLFVSDSSDLQAQRGARIMVFDLSPESLAGLERNELPETIATLGQPDTDTWDLGVGPAKIGGSGTGLVDEERQLLFFSDGGNSRVLVWDIDPERLETGMEDDKKAMGVIKTDLNMARDKRPEGDSTRTEFSKIIPRIASRSR